MYKCSESSPQGSAQSDETDDESNDENPEPLFEQLDSFPLEETTTPSPVSPSAFDPAIVRGNRHNQIDANQKTAVVRMLDNVASSLIYMMRPICALTNKVQILKSFLRNIWIAE
jgi:hypothetical protein